MTISNLPQNQEKPHYLIKTDFPEGNHVLGRHLGCYLYYFNIKWDVAGVASLNFRTQKSEKTPLMLH